MSLREIRPLLEDMREHTRLAIGAVEGRAREGIRTDLILRAACERFIYIVGEAASQVPDDFRNQYPQIPWRSITGTRVILAHRYRIIDPDILWDILTVELPELLKNLDAILSDLRFV